MQFSYKYFLPIKVENLSFYLLSGAFAPANFYEGREKDVQSLFANQLLLSSSNLVGDSDCSIELVLNKLELEQLTKIADSEDCYLFTSFLPASRLVRVIFKNKKEAEYIRTTINLSTAILTEDQCSSGPLNCSAFKPTNSKASKISAYDNYIKYQRLLGALALMRIVNEDQYTFNLDYLPFLAKYNEQIKYALATQKISPNAKAYSNLELLKCIIKSESEGSAMHKAAAYKDAINEFARKEGYAIKLDPIKHTYDHSSLGGVSSILAYIHDYKVNDLDAGGRFMIDSLITKRFSGVPSASQVAFYYGYSRGYAKFKKKYESVVYKYDFSNRLDRYVAEIVYNISCSIKETNQFEFLDILYRPTVSHLALKDGEYMVLGQKIVGKKKAKIGSEEWFEQFYQSLEERCSILFEGFESLIAPSLLSTILNNVRTLIQKAISFTIESVNTQLEELNQNHKDEIAHLQEEHWAEIEKLSKESEKNERKIRGEYSLLLADVDKSLFDRIDTDGDGILSYEEVTEFTRVLISIHDEAKKMQASNDESLSINNADVAETTEQTPKEELKDNEQDNTAPDITSEAVATVDGTSDSTSADSQTVNKTVEDSKEDNADSAVIIEDLAPQTTIDESSEEASCIESTDSEAITDEFSTDITQETYEIISTEALPNNVDKKEQSNTTNIQTSLTLD